MWDCERVKRLRNILSMHHLPFGDHLQLLTFRRLLGPPSSISGTDSFVANLRYRLTLTSHGIIISARRLVDWTSSPKKTIWFSYILPFLRNASRKKKKNEIQFDNHPVSLFPCINDATFHSDFAVFLSHFPCGFCKWEAIMRHAPLTLSKQYTHTHTYVLGINSRTVAHHQCTSCALTHGNDGTHVTMKSV